VSVIPIVDERAVDVVGGTTQIAYANPVRCWRRRPNAIRVRRNVSSMTADESTIGREHDVAHVEALLVERGRCTITGAGGVGKSHLARVVAERSGRPPVWVDGESVDTTEALAAALVAQVGGEVLPGERAADAAVAGIDGHDVLVVLDGIEHLGADAEHFVSGLPSVAHGTRGPQLLTTTRRRPGPPPCHPLRPLPTVGGGATQQLLAATLVELGEPDLLGDLADLTEVLEATGGLPLAVQLIANQLVLTGTFAGDGQVHDGGSIDPAMTRSVERSLALAPSTARDTFRILGLTTSAVSAPLAAGYTGRDVDDVAGDLAALRAVGLATAVPGGFDLLPPVRDAAYAMFVASPDQDVRFDVAVTWAIDRLHAIAAAGSDDTSEQQLDDLAHLGWLAVRRQHPSALRLVDALFDPLHVRIRNREALALMRAALSVPDRPAELCAQVLRRAAIAASECETALAGTLLLDEAEALAVTLDEPAELLCRIASIRASIFQDGGRLTDARRAAERAIVHAEHARLDDYWAWQARHRLACVAREMGDLDEAESHARACIAWGTANDPFVANLGTIELAWCEVERGHTAQAAALARMLATRANELIGPHSEVGLEADTVACVAEPRWDGDFPQDDRDLTWWLRLTRRLHLAACAPISEHWPIVLRLAADVVTLADAIGMMQPAIEGRLVLGDAALAGGELRQAHHAYDGALRDAVRCGYRLRAADALDGFASLAVALDALGEGRAASGFAAELRRRCDAVARPRPTLPQRHVEISRPPDSWIRDRLPTTTAIDVVSGSLAARLAMPGTVDPVLDMLTPTEREVALRAATGTTNQRIADDLFVSRRTVESHLVRIYRKLDVHSRTQLAARLHGHA
jgi:DNA-binding CsgD family transcriptional regulator